MAETGVQGAPDEVRERLKARIPREWGLWVSVGDGWLPIVDRLDRQLAEIDPDYEIHQVKEKFGGLRYYCSLEADDRGADLIREAEVEASKTCEVCGSQDGVTTAGPGWIRTLCAEHRT